MGDIDWDKVYPHGIDTNEYGQIENMGIWQDQTNNPRDRLDQGRPFDDFYREGRPTGISTNIPQRPKIILDPSRVNENYNNLGGGIDPKDIASNQTVLQNRISPKGAPVMSDMYDKDGTLRDRMNNLNSPIVKANTGHWKIPPAPRQVNPLNIPPRPTYRYANTPVQKIDQRPIYQSPNIYQNPYPLTDPNQPNPYPTGNIVPPRPQSGVMVRDANGNLVPWTPPSMQNQGMAQTEYSGIYQSPQNMDNVTKTILESRERNITAQGQNWDQSVRPEPLTQLTAEQRIAQSRAPHNIQTTPQGDMADSRRWVSPDAYKPVPRPQEQPSQVNRDRFTGLGQDAESPTFKIPQRPPLEGFAKMTVVNPLQRDMQPQEANLRHLAITNPNALNSKVRGQMLASIAKDEQERIRRETQAESNRRFDKMAENPDINLTPQERAAKIRLEGVKDTNNTRSEIAFKNIQSKEKMSGETTQLKKDLLIMSGKAINTPEHEQAQKELIDNITKKEDERIRGLQAQGKIINTEEYETARSNIVKDKIQELINAGLISEAKDVELAAYKSGLKMNEEAKKSPLTRDKPMPFNGQKPTGEAIKDVGKKTYTQKQLDAFISKNKGLETKDEYKKQLKEIQDNLSK